MNVNRRSTQHSYYALNIYRSVICLALTLFCTSLMQAQSTFATVLGTVKDPSGASVPGAIVELQNSATAESRKQSADAAGGFSFVDVEPGSYVMTVEAPGFTKSQLTGIVLQTRETRRVDAAMTVAQSTSAVTVNEAAAAPIDTDASSIAETKTTQELNDLPVAIYSRSTGSTSPISTLTTQPGVQTDAAGNLAVAGALPSLTAVSIDGISSISYRNSGPITELFPSFNAIEEIHVNETSNAAEYGGVSSITTISRGGGNLLHGGAFENLGNKDLNAKGPFALTTPAEVMNNFGGYLGGPVVLPKVYNGHNKTFFFVSYEGLRLPRQTTLIESVPSMNLREGILTGYTSKQIKSAGGTPFPNNVIPPSMISPVSTNLLADFFPQPNVASSNPNVNNFITNIPNPISSDQGDVRLDHAFTQNERTYVHISYKNRQVTVTPGGTYFEGPISEPEKDLAFVVAHTSVFTPTLVNEARIGGSGNHINISAGISPTLIEQAGMQGLFSLPQGAAMPSITISGFQGTSGTAAVFNPSTSFEALDNLTWIRGKNTFKFGGDFIQYRTQYNNVYANSREGSYKFNGSSSFGQTIGSPFAEFLLGVPDSTSQATVTGCCVSGYDNKYAFYAQDDWKVSSTLTLNVGLRWNYNPYFNPKLGNMDSFLTNYSSTVNGQVVQGAIMSFNQAGLSNLDPQTIASIGSTPVITPAQAGLPGFRYVDRTDFQPRIGFAWRPFHNDKTVIRGGYGRFMADPLGGSTSLSYSVLQSFLGVYSQSSVNGVPALRFPSPFPSNLGQLGSFDIDASTDIHLHDPYVQQYNLTIERDLGKSIGLRLSYVGSHGTQLIQEVDQNQIPYNTVGFATAYAERPYPDLGLLQELTNGGFSNYNAATVAVKRRFSNGLQFEVNYSFTRDLSNEAGEDPTGFAGGTGSFVSNTFQRGLDYGNVAYDRKHRFLATFLYELPFGKSKPFLTNANGMVDRLVGHWELSGVLTLESGPFLTPIASGADPTGIGFPTLYGTSRADTVSGVSPYTSLSNPIDFLNAAAFAIPANNIGRMGDASVGSVIGPKLHALSLSLIKAVPITERVRAQFGIQAANILNQVNYAVPGLSLGTSTFGVISGLATGEGAGPRQVQATVRVQF